MARWLLILLAAAGAWGAPRLAPVPFVGCAADGQTGPQPAPAAPKGEIWVDAALAGKLAYYASAASPGVLAPRGWHCFGTFGSGGATTVVGPEPMSADTFFGSDRPHLPGPRVISQITYGGTSGRWVVAELISRLFRDRRDFVAMVAALEPGTKFPTHPFAGDRLRYRGPRLVEYRTAAGSEGLGTSGWLTPGAEAIAGAVMLTADETPDILRLSVRLPSGMGTVRRAIVEQFAVGARGR